MYICGSIICEVHVWDIIAYQFHKIVHVLGAMSASMNYVDVLFWVFIAPL